jgi:2-enoate reductase
VGCETAYLLAAELGRHVTVIEMLPAFMRGTCTANRGHLIHALGRAGVTLLNCARLVRVEPATVTVARNISLTVPDPAITWTPLLPENVVNPLARPLKVEERELTLPAGLVVLATGMLPDASLYRACMAARVASEIHVLGDAFAPGRVFEAVKAGYAVGTAL